MTQDNVATLDEVRQGVPLRKEPLWWDRRLPLAANVNALQRYVAEYSRFTPPGSLIDEAAIMVPGERHADTLGLELAAGGWKRFNSAQDLVHANPFGTRYVVQYHFFRHPKVDWRIEVMHMAAAWKDGERGFSPLHQALWTPNGATPFSGMTAQLPIPHLSFKAPVSEAGPRTRDGARALRWVLDEGCVMAQACQSTYGHFWYCLPCDARKQLYVKPRVNLRDES